MYGFIGFSGDGVLGISEFLTVPVLALCCLWEMTGQTGHRFIFAFFCCSKQKSIKSICLYSALIKDY